MSEAWKLFQEVRLSLYDRGASHHNKQESCGPVLYIRKDPEASSLYCHPLFSAVGVFAYGIHQREASASVLVNSALFCNLVQTTIVVCFYFLTRSKLSSQLTSF